MGDMAGFRDEKLPPFHRQATGIPSRKLRPVAGSCEQGRMFSEGRVLVTKVSQLGWHVVSALAADRYARNDRRCFQGRRRHRPSGCAPKV